MLASFHGAANSQHPLQPRLGSRLSCADLPGSAALCNFAVASITRRDAHPGSASLCPLSLRHRCSSISERALSELEGLVERLERGDLPLEEALRTFERGVELTRQCQSSLRAAQQKVEILLQRGDRSSIEPFSGSDESGLPPE